MAARAKIAGVEVGDGLPVRIMAVINVSPESFYKGSVARDRAEVAERALALARAGADFIDIGGRSTAPYLETYVPADVERERVVGAVRAVRDSLGGSVPISVDTTRASVAEAALSAGADMVNDVSGLREDPEMARVVADHGVPLVVVARVREYRAGAKPIEMVLESLRESLEIARRAGVDEGVVVVDPGIGFNRFKELPWYEWDCSVLAELWRLRELGRPILVGASRKSFIGAITGRGDPSERLPGSLAAAAIAVYNGAHILRTHDPAETRDAALVAERIRRHRPGWPT